ncbi:MAG: sodium:solute symporter [Lentimicrobiaceae bacterium]|mgnify:CR=1 FL=1|nr:sodium:solute symporter [Lentimicrobiaceae bacterium]
MENLILIVFVAYTLLILLVAHLSSRKSNNNAFFTGNRKSPWFVVAYGMIGASLSGVTFMSVPGGVYSGQFTYFGIVLGYIIGYAVIAFLLLPLYYKLNLTSIYSYLEIKFGKSSEKTGALLFIISRLIGSAIRMYLVVFVLYEFVFKAWGIPFWIPALIFILLILVYTFKGGIKAVVWTDTLQTTFLLLAAVMTVIIILKTLNISFGELMSISTERGYTKLFETDWSHSKFFVKQILSGAFITITMTGLDQDMMQKNLTCKSLKDAQKNVMTSSFFFVLVNVLFMSLGAALIYYVQEVGLQLPVNESGVVVNDKIFPTVAFSLNKITAIVFMLGLIAAGYSSADGTLTALTTTFCFDFLHFDKNDKITEEQKIKYRKMIHIGFAFLYLLVIIMFRPFHNESLIDKIFEIAGYTYGPLLGLYSFGLFVKNRKPNDKYVPIIAIASPIISYLLNLYSQDLFWGYQFGFEILIVNGLLTFTALLFISKKSININ